MDKYKVSGPRSVAGKKPGETVSTDELAGCNIDALVTAGHLTPATPTKTPKVTNPEEQ